MVFHCRCFSLLLEEEDDEYETATQTQTKSTTTFYTAASDFNQSIPISHANTSEMAEKRNNLRVFTLAELEAATDNFCTASNIGEGVFGTVYKGVIKSLEYPFDEIQVAMKLANGLLRGHKEWESDIVLGVVDHPNLVKLLGYCAEDNELLLVYEYMVNGSVRDHLSAKSETPLSWEMRLKVAQDAARGLTYLHEEMDYQIIFKNFKSSNILLDDQWNAKLLDLGMPRIIGPDRIRAIHMSNRIAGFMEYAAPEYFSVGHITSKSDVWCYGIFLYELITCMHGSEWIQPLTEQMLLDWVKPYLGSKRFHKIVDPRLEGNYPLKSAQKLCIIANKCLSDNPKSRPKMSEVLEMVNQLIRDPSQAPQVPHVAVEPNKNFVGPTQDEKTIEDAKHESERCSMNIQPKKPACLPRIRPWKLLKSCSKKGCCVSLH